MKVIIEFDQMEDQSDLQIISHLPQISSAIFEIKHNLRRQFEHRIDSGEFESSQDLLDAMIIELDELLPDIDMV